MRMQFFLVFPCLGLSTALNMPGTCHLVRKKLQCVSDLLATEVFSVSSASCFKTQEKGSREEAKSETRTKVRKLAASRVNFTWSISHEVIANR